MIDRYIINLIIIILIFRKIKKNNYFIIKSINSIINIIIINIKDLKLPNIIHNY